MVRVITALLLLAGLMSLVWASSANRDLRKQIEQLEAELGRMPIGASDRVHLVEIETPDVPPEVASQLERIWQFRCYLPPGYDVIRFSGGGRVAKEGVYLSGGSNSGWGSPRTEATHQLVTLSLRKTDDRLEAFESFGGSSGTITWGHFDPDRLGDALVVQKLVSSEQGPRSFDQETILPLLKIYDPRSAEEKELEGESIMTYPGGLFVLCPKSREADFNRLRRGETPVAYESSWIATGAGDD